MDIVDFIFIFLFLLFGVFAFISVSLMNADNICTDNKMILEASSNDVVRCGYVNAEGKVSFKDFDRKTGEEIKKYD